MRGLAAVFLAAAVSFTATLPLRRLAVRYGILDRPGAHKSHAKPIPYLGGIAVLLGLLAAFPLLRLHPAVTIPLIGVVAALGLFDDLRFASVATKLVGEGAAAIAAVGLGFVWHLTDSSLLNSAVSVIWIVGLTNSFNLLDNMDGLSSVVAIGSLLTIAFVAPTTLPLTLPLAGALFGFLLVNRPPARMYLGDTGSLMIGFVVAIATIAASNTGRGVHSLVLLAGAVALALFDTSLVIVSRLANGRPVQLGGKDHFSHRLALLGCGPYQILGITLLASTVGGVITFLATRYPANSAWIALPLAVVYVGCWVRLLRVDPYRAEANFYPEVLRVQS